MPTRRRRGDAAAVKALLKKGADVNAAQGDGMTALHWAASHGDAALAQMLLSAGANIRATTRLGGITALHMASQGGHAQVVAALIAAGADANTIDRDRRDGRDAGGACRQHRHGDAAGRNRR